ncbi:MAG: class I SAM-dependent methyltransferase [Dehalococcoidia bacterium]|nr:class I SAM-dependent methyltransferase [Dehalococcoidia bacterium]
MTARYDVIGAGYATRRQPDPRIERQIGKALGDSATVLNVGAGSGSYEPRDRFVVAVEPSMVQLRQRRKAAAPAIQGVAEALPFLDRSFDACLAVLTVHHWSDGAAGLKELRRVARHRIVILTHDFRGIDLPWLVRDYFPGIVVQDRERFAPIEEVVADLGGARVDAVPIPADCADGFMLAHWRQPERYLDASVRAAMSGFLAIPEHEVENGVARLRADLDSGEWRRRNAALLDLDAYDGGYRLIVAELR